MISCFLDGEEKDLAGTSFVLSVTFCGNSSIRIFLQKETQERKELRALGLSMISCFLDGEEKDLAGTSSVLSVTFRGNSSIRIF
jgi:hypothetical protein